MKSTETYRTLRGPLAPAFKAAGFKRMTGMLSWARPQGSRFLVVWCQVSQNGWDPYAGSKFVTEFQLSDEPAIGAQHVGRGRLGKMVGDTGREQVRAIQNSIVAALPRPPADHFVLSLSEDVRNWYLNSFEPVLEPYTEGDDIWLRYRTKDHLVTWAQFIISVLPACLDKAARWETQAP